MFQFVAHLVFGILWLIITIVQVVVGLIAWLVWYIIRKVVEEKCTQDDARDLCVCDADKSVPFTGKEREPILIYNWKRILKFNHGNYIDFTNGRINRPCCKIKTSRKI